MRLRHKIAWIDGPPATQVPPPRSLAEAGTKLLGTAGLAAAGLTAPLWAPAVPGLLATSGMGALTLGGMGAVQRAVGGPDNPTNPDPDDTVLNAGRRSAMMGAALGPVMAGAGSLVGAGFNRAAASPWGQRLAQQVARSPLAQRVSSTVSNFFRPSTTAPPSALRTHTGNFVRGGVASGTMGAAFGFGLGAPNDNSLDGRFRAARQAFTRDFIAGGLGNAGAGAVARRMAQSRAGQNFINRFPGLARAGGWANSVTGQGVGEGVADRVAPMPIARTPLITLEDVYPTPKFIPRYGGAGGMSFPEGYAWDPARGYIHARDAGKRDLSDILGEPGGVGGPNEGMRPNAPRRQAPRSRPAARPTTPQTTQAPPTAGVTGYRRVPNGPR